MYSKILVPLDGSARAEAILPHVKNMARHYKAVVIFLGIVEPEPAVLTPEPFYTSLDPAMYHQRVVEVKNYLTVKKNKFQQRGIDAQICVSEGPVVEEIINVAQREQVDLIAMVSHGRTGLPRVFYGSVAAGVLHRIDRPLLLVRTLDNETS